MESRRCGEFKNVVIYNVVKIQDAALQDIENVHDYIAYELFEPVTADKYLRGIYDARRKYSGEWKRFFIKAIWFIRKKYKL